MSARTRSSSSAAPRRPWPDIPLTCGRYPAAVTAQQRSIHSFRKRSCTRNVLVDLLGRQLRQLLGQHTLPRRQPPHYIPVGVRQTRERRRCHNVMGARLACFAAVTPAFAIAVLPDDQRADALSLLMRNRARLPSRHQDRSGRHPACGHRQSRVVGPGSINADSLRAEHPADAAASASAPGRQS